MEHEISVEEFHSRKEAHKLTITIQERGSTSSKEETFKKLKEAQARVQLGTTPKIRKVLMLRGHKHYRKYCEPRVVSLGPIHHGKPAYQLTEEYKLMLADKFIGKTGRTVEELYGIIEDNIKELREYYDEKVTQKYSDEDLAWMLFVDGCATLQFIDSIVNGPFKDVKIKKDQAAFVRQDLFLLENQLPYQLLDYLMKNIIEEENWRESIQNFINKHSMLVEDTDPPNDENAIHLPHRPRIRSVRTVVLQSRQELPSTIVNTVPNKKDKKPPSDENAIHLLDLLRKRLLGLDGVKDETAQNKETGKEEWQSFRNVQELKEAGIHLKSSPSSCLRDIKFTKKWNFYPGILQLPRITVDDSTGPMFFNLIAYEMSPDFENDFGITSYICFLDSLIDESKDVIDLRKAGILRNLLGSDQEVALVFNEIGTDLVPNPVIYRDVKLDIQEYFDKKSMTWISQFLHAHFSSPWTVIAFLAAFFALCLTVVQTVYSVLAYYKE